MAARPIGFTGDNRGKDQKAIRDLFSPEFRNRLDAIVSFNPLDRTVMEQIVDKAIAELQSQLKDSRVAIRLTPAARRWLADKGFDPDYGARPLRRLVTTEIGDVLADEILFGALKRGGTATVGVKGGKLSFAYRAGGARGRSRASRAPAHAANNE